MEISPMARSSKAMSSVIPASNAGIASVILDVLLLVSASEAVQHT
jgi:hypothetical protein